MSQYQQNRHIIAAVQHLTLAAKGSDKKPEAVEHSGISGSPLVDQDAGGQVLFYDLQRIVERERELYFSD